MARTPISSSPLKAAFQVAIVVGRWQLPHLGHQSLFEKALSVSERVIVVIGSSFRSRDTKNPFTWQERQAMIEGMLSPAELERVSFLPIRDYHDDDRWNRAVQKGVESLVARTDKLALVGFKKDSTSYYLDNFPSWQSVDVQPTVDIDATALRKVYFESEDMGTCLKVLKPYLHPAVSLFLQAWSKLPCYALLAREQAVIVAYRKKWTAPWYQTADAVVQVSGHVLLIQRGGDVGYGLWAVPGGFVNEGERIYPAALRELKEETSLAFLRSTMKGALRSSAVFDHPLRSPRGRIVTQAFHFVFGPGNLPEVHARDDAMEARWVPIAELPSYEDKLFEDHGTILDHFVGLYPK